MGGSASLKSWEPYPSPEWHLAPANHSLLSLVASLLSTIPFSSYAEQLTFLIFATESVLRIQNLIPLLGPPTKKFSTCLLASEPLRPSLFSCYSYVQGTSGSGSLKCWDWARAADIICPMGLGFLSVQMRMGWDQEALLHLWTFYWYRFGVESACISGARKLKVLLRSITYSWSEISSLNGK